MKKLASLLLALVMIMSCFSAMAESPETYYSITIDSTVSGHTYEAYQIFKGDIANAADSDAVAGTGAILSNIEWGTSVTYNGTGVDVTNEDGTTSKSTSPVEIAKALAAGTLTLENLIKDLTLTTTYATSIENKDNDGNTTNYTIANLVAGYYLVKDKDGSLDNKESEAYTKFIIEVVEDSVAKPKSAVPESEKKVKDTNDTTGNTTDWQDSADYDIGDEVPFQLSGTVAENYADYKVYKFVFHDKLSAGLTFTASSVKVYVGGVEITSGYELVTNPDDDCSFEVKFADLKQIDSVKAGSEITVEYTAKLNENAELGNLGNSNTMHLEYSNNPNDEDGGDTGNTPDDTVIVFTYTVIVDKVDEKDQPLEGAGFTLYKKATDGSWVEVSDGNEDEGNEISGEALTQFQWKGLDDGDYKLVETTTPAGFNTIEDILFTITAEHDVVATTATLTKLEGGDLFTEDLTKGSLSTEVVNKAGSTLPETGGMGTTLLYVGGGILVLAAIVLLIAKRRTSAE